jgi:hypothetical protein
MKQKRTYISDLTKRRVYSYYTYRSLDSWKNINQTRRNRFQAAVKKASGHYWIRPYNRKTFLAVSPGGRVGMFEFVCKCEVNNCKHSLEPRQCAALWARGKLKEASQKYWPIKNDCYLRSILIEQSL